MIKGHGEYFTKEMAERVIDSYQLYKQRNIDPITGLVKAKSAMFDYTTLAAALSVMNSSEEK